MVVMPRESWTDARLDDFRGEMNRRFDEVYRRFGEVDKRLDETNERMEAGFARINDRLDALYHLLFRGMIAFGVGVFGVIAAFMLQQ
jgi:hypothetical protein